VPKKINILFVAPRFHTNQLYWVQALTSHGHRVNFFSLHRSIIEDYSCLNSELIKISKISQLIIKIFGDGGSNTYRGFPNPISYYIMIKRINPDMVIVRDIGRWFSLLTILFTKMKKIKIIIYSQTVLYSKRTGIRLLIFELIFKITKGIWITPIKGEPNKSIKIPSKLFFVPFAVRINPSRKITNNNQIEVLSIGKFVERKNHLLLLKSVKKLISDQNKIHLTIIGECTTAEHNVFFDKVSEFIRINNIKRHITVKTNVPHNKIDKYYMSSDVFVLPASNEPASISILEALGYGLPVICSNNCGTQYYIKEDFNGYIFNDNSLDNLINKMRLMSSEENINRLKKNISSTVHSTISEKNYYNTFINLINLNFHTSY
jgi:glycosyltransferase involved in cell wall biosynthesis